MNTPTPRTNRFYASFADGECIPNQDEWLALCESLETELTAACQEIDMLKSKYADHHAEAERLTSEINAVTKQRDVASQCHKWCYEDRKRITEELTAVTDQRDRLQRWKDEQLAIEIKWNPQAVGRLLGMTVGDEIREGIEPAIRSLIEQRDRLAQALRWIVVVYATEAEYKQVAQKALAAVKGGDQ
jgi:DNA repair exonuclease SbcCD ATPase subunit